MLRSSLTCSIAILGLSLLLASTQGATLRASSSVSKNVDGLVNVIVHTPKPYNNLTGAIEEMGGVVTVTYRNADAIAAAIPPHRVGRLLASPGVIRIEKDPTVNLPAPPEELMDMRPLPLVEAKLLTPETLAAQIGELPENYRSYLAELTGASEVWEETSSGAGTMVAVIDTGTDASHPCLSGSGQAGIPQTRVIAGPDLSPDAGTEFEGSTSPTNNYHGTFAAGMAASHCFIALDERVPEDAELAAVFQDHFPPGTVFAAGHNLMVPLVGLAPAASIYAVKVFPHTGSGVASSIISAAVDHIITVKELSNGGFAGGVDVDIITHEPWRGFIGRRPDAGRAVGGRGHQGRDVGRGLCGKRGACARVGLFPRHSLHRPDRRGGQRPGPHPYLLGHPVWPGPGGHPVFRR